MREPPPFDVFVVLIKGRLDLDLDSIPNGSLGDELVTGLTFLVAFPATGGRILLFCLN